MFIITKLPFHRVESYVRRAYSSSQSLLDKWHVVAGSGLDSCVQDTMRVLEHDTHPDFQFYVVEEDGKFVGYFGTENERSYLTTFFVRPEFRKRKNEFWDAILPFMDSVFLSALYSKNLPCVGFYEKMGRAIQKDRIPGKAEHFTLFKFEKAGT